MWVLLILLIIVLSVCNREGFLAGYSFGFGGYPTGRPYNLYAPRKWGYGQNNPIHYGGGPVSYPGGPNLGQLHNQWYVPTAGPM